MQDTSETTMGTVIEAIVVPEDGGIWVSWIGGKIQYVATREQTGGNYCAMRGKVAPGGGAPLHRHPFHEGFYVMTGEVAVVAGREEIRLSEGDFINVAAGTVHRICNNSTSPAEVLTIAAPAGFDRFQLEAGERLGGPDETGTLTREQIVERMHTLAPQYQIDLNPGPEALEETPRFTIRRAGEGESIAVVGDLYTFLVTGDDTEGAYAIWHATVPPGGGPPMHLHRYEEEAFFVLSGEMTFFAGGRELVAGPGTFVVLPRNGLHRFQNMSTGVAKMLILVAPAGLERMFRETGVPWSHLSEPIPPPSPAEIERLIQTAPRYGVELQLPSAVE